jgi:hypothetical protein
MRYRKIENLCRVHGPRIAAGVKADAGSLTAANLYAEAIDLNHAPSIKVAMDDAAAMAAPTPIRSRAR